MNEKRFKVVQDPRVQTEYFIYDNENKISRNITDYPFLNQDVCSRIVRLLNELSTSCRQLEGEVKFLNAFLVHKGFAEEYTRWKLEVDV